MVSVLGMCVSELIYRFNNCLFLFEVFMNENRSATNNGRMAGSKLMISVSSTGKPTLLAASIKCLPNFSVAGPPCCPSSSTPDKR